MKKDIESVKAEFESKGYTLLESSYKNNKTKMKYRCNSHNFVDQFIRYNDLQQGHGCSLCSKESRVDRMRKLAEDQRLKEVDLKSELDLLKYDLVEGSYINARMPLQFICRRHPKEIQKSRIGDIRRGFRCSFCRREGIIPTKKTGKNTPIPIDFMRQVSSDFGYEFVDGIREGGVLYVLYRCNKHPEDTARKTKFYDYRNGKACKECGLDKIRGKNHYNYDPTKTEEEREFDRRLDQEEKRWRREVYGRDNYKCVICGKDRDLNAHHKDGYTWCVDRRYDVKNGVTLCKDCHVDFHKEYGFGDNTEEQFNEWLITFDKGGRLNAHSNA